MRAQAKAVMGALTRAGFDDARVTITEKDVNELSIAHNHISLMRTTQSQSLALMAVQAGRRATTSVSSLEESVIEQATVNLRRDVMRSPQDEAYAVAPNQTGSFEKGPQSVDPAALAASAKTLLEIRRAQYPSFQIEECAIKHTRLRTVLVTHKRN